MKYFIASISIASEFLLTGSLSCVWIWSQTICE